MLITALAALPLLAAMPQDGDPVMPADKGETHTTASGLKYCSLRDGFGAKPKNGDKVTVHYSGWLTDGTLFDSSRKRGQPFAFTPGQGRVIKGWEEAALLMPQGAKYKFTIPPDLGYGARGAGGTIPPNATLVFEIEMLSFVSMPEFKEPVKEAQKTTESGIVWETLKASEGAVPKPGELVELRYAFWSPSRNLLDCSEMSNQTLKGVIGRLPVKFMDEMALLVPVGARVRCEVPAALGIQRPMPGVKEGARTVWEIEVVSAKPAPPVPEFALSDPAKLVKTASGLQYEVIREGTGTKPKPTSRVTVHYAGWLTDGTMFDNSFERGEPTTFGVGQVIRGWTEGLQLMKEGAVYKFTIPGDLAYGQRGSGDKIPPNATLVFHVELIEVQG